MHNKGRTRLALAGALVLYALASLAIVYWALPSVDAYYRARPIDNVARILAFLAMLWFLVPASLIGVFVYFYGRAILRAGQRPPPGWEIFGPEKVLVGRRARMMGVGACVGGVLAFLGPVAVAGYFFYVFFVR